MSWSFSAFETLYGVPSRNGIYKSSEHHGDGAKIVNMGELFAHEFVGPQDMSRLTMSEAELEKAGLVDGDLLFGRRSLVEAGAGKCSVVEGLVGPTTFESSIIRVRLDLEKALPRFYYYWFRSRLGRGSIRAIVSGTNVKGIRGSELKNVLVPMLDLDDQLRISDALSAYDNLIENNRRRSVLLEESARLLYRKWFVHLRFPGHEHVKVAHGVPEGWGRTLLPALIDINPTERIDRAKEAWYVPMAALSETGMIVDRRDFERRTSHTAVKFRNGDVLLARITPCLENGKTAFVYFLDEDEVACGSTEFIVLRGMKISSHFVYCLSRTYDFREHAIKSMIGSSGRQRVQTSCFSEYLTPLPPSLLLREFDCSVEPMFEQIVVLQRENEKLSQARDLLLPRLMSGEIQV